jgi:HlyD family secretion protein
MKLPKKLFGFLLLIVVLAVAAGGIYYRINGKREAEAAPATERTAVDAPDNSATDAFSTDLPIPVEGVAAIMDTLVMEVSASGQAVAFQSTVIKTLVAGPIRSVPVRENAPIALGGVLVEIDPTEARLNLDEAQARLEKAQAEFRVQTIGDDRITDPAVKADREKAARLKSGIDEAEIAVRKAQLNLERTRVNAPFAGRVASVKVVPGQHVSAGEEVLTVLDIDPIKVEVQVLESEIGYLSPGRGAKVSFAAFPDEIFTGRISTINPMVDEKTRAAKVTLLVPNPRGRILPGFYAKVSLDARRIPNVLLVPRSAILERDVDRRTLLFVFNGEGDAGTAEWRYVKVGRGNANLVEIVLDDPDPQFKRVEPGEIVLVRGHTTLTHGARVRLADDAAAEGGRPN